MHLPSWSDMTDTDKAAAVAFLWRRRFYGSKAWREMPCTYRDHPDLTSMSPALANNHAVTLSTHVQRLTRAESNRLHAIDLKETRTPCPS